MNQQLFVSNIGFEGQNHFLCNMDMYMQDIQLCMCNKQHPRFLSTSLSMHMCKRGHVEVAWVLGKTTSHMGQQAKNIDCIDRC